MNWSGFLSRRLVLALCLATPMTRPVSAQEAARPEWDPSKGPPAFPNVFGPYSEQAVPPSSLDNSARLRSLIRSGKLELTLSDALALALENNLNIAAQRLVRPIAATDVLRAGSGQAARGFAGAQIPGGLTAGALGVGVSAAGGGGGLGGAGGITGGGGAISLGSSGNFDPTFSLNFSWDRVTSPLNTIQVAGIPVVTGTATAISGNFAQLFHTGGSYSLSLTGQRQSSTQQRLRFNPAVVTRFSLGLHQPLLNGFGLEPNERFIRVARNNSRVSLEVFRQQVITTIVEVENAYWNLAALQENVRVAEQSLSVSQRLLEDNRLRVDIGTMSPVEVTAAEAEVAARTRDLTFAITNLQLQETTLKSLLAKTISPDLEAAALVLSDRMPEPRDSDLPEPRTALEDAMKYRPDLHQAATALENQEIAARFTRQALRPSLAIFGLYAGAGLQGVGAGDVSGAGDALRSALQGDFPEYGGGLSLSLPLRNRVAQADSLRAQLEANQLRLELQKLRNQAHLEVSKARIGLIQGRAQVEAAREAVRLAREIRDGEQIRLEAGVSTSYQLILRERDLVAARQAEVVAIVGYAKALVEMGRSTGQTLDRNGILLEDAESGNVTRAPMPLLRRNGEKEAGVP